jgi:hypothetical protein
MSQYRPLKNHHGQDAASTLVPRHFAWICRLLGALLDFGYARHAEPEDLTIRCFWVHALSSVATARGRRWRFEQHTLPSGQGRRPFRIYGRDPVSIGRNLCFSETAGHSYNGHGWYFLYRAMDLLGRSRYSSRFPQVTRFHECGLTACVVAN